MISLKLKQTEMKIEESFSEILCFLPDDFSDLKKNGVEHWIFYK
jgi:hypothetical protein